MKYSKYADLTPGALPDVTNLSHQDVVTDSNRSAVEPHGWADVGYIPQRDETLDPAKCFDTYGDYALVDDAGVLWSSRSPIYLPDADCAARQRQTLSNQINAQVPSPTPQQVSNDPRLDTDMLLSLAAANTKEAELADTPDGGLGGFDPTINPAPADDASVGLSRLSGIITDVEEWLGAPGNDLGMLIELETEIGEEASGAEARIQVLSGAGADNSGVFPLEQDPVNLRIWTWTSRDGGKWADPDNIATLTLLWGAGSLRVMGVMSLLGYGNRKAAVVEYAVATGQALSRDSRVPRL